MQFLVSLEAFHDSLEAVKFCSCKESREKLPRALILQTSRTVFSNNINIFKAK